MACVGPQRHRKKKIDNVISYNLIIIKTDIIFEGGIMSTHLHLVLRLIMSGDMPPFSLYVFKAFIEATL